MHDHTPSAAPAIAAAAVGTVLVLGTIAAAIAAVFHMIGGMLQ